MNEKYLFAHGYLREALEAHRQKMAAAIDSAEASQVSNGQSVEDIADGFVQEFVSRSIILSTGSSPLLV